MPAARSHLWPQHVALLGYAAAALATVACGGGGEQATAASGSGASSSASSTSSSSSSGGDGGIKPPPSDPRWPACDPTAKSQALTFVHVNDLHANYQLDAMGQSPYARIRGFYKSVLAESPYTVFTSGGDEFEKGALAEVLSQGASTLAVLDAMAFDVRVIGNHDYAWSEDELLRMSHDARASVLESNVSYTGTSTIGFGAKPWVTLEIGCLKVGFAGMVSQPWNDQDQQVDQSFYADLPASYDFNSEAMSIVAQHRSEVDVLVLVDHIGLALDGLIGVTVPGVDVILSGHSHDLTMMPQMSGSAVVIQSGAFAEHVLRLDLSYDFASKTLTQGQYVVGNVDGTLPPDAAMQTTVEGVLAQYAPHATDPVGVVSAAGTASSIATVAAKAAMVKFATDAAVVDTQTVWNLWSPGSVSDQDLLDAFKIERELPGTPGFNSFYTVSVTGTGIEAIRSGVGTRFVAILPPTTTPTTMYTLAIQKRPAYQPATWFPGLAVTNLTFGAEAWEALDFYAKQRTTGCLFLDVDQKPSPCP